jgi:hypothetical protein
MQFIARVKPGTGTFKNWTIHRKGIGVVGGVRFARRPSGYFSGPLTPLEYEAMSMHPDVLVEAVGTLPVELAGPILTAPEVEELPVAEPEPAPETDEPDEAPLLFGDAPKRRGRPPKVRY